jgi:hypothetical protein
VKRIANEDGLNEVQPVESVREGFRIDITRSQTHRNSENQSTVRDASAEFLPPTPLSVHVMRIEIAALASVHDDVSFGYSPAQGFAG